jgi:hypothetical protein
MQAIAKQANPCFLGEADLILRGVREFAARKGYEVKVSMDWPQCEDEMVEISKGGHWFRMIVKSPKQLGFNADIEDAWGFVLINSRVPETPPRPHLYFVENFIWRASWSSTTLATTPQISDLLKSRIGEVLG